MALRPFRVGITQSNISTPRAMDSTMLTGVPTLLRDLAALAYVLLVERSSLTAYRWLWRHRWGIRRRRSAIREQRTVKSAALNRWFFRKGLSL